MEWGKGQMRRIVIMALEAMSGACVRLALCFAFCAAQLQDRAPPSQTSHDSQSSP
jgi:hypothetical protein